MTTANQKASPESAVETAWYDLIDDPEPPEDTMQARQHHIQRDGDTQGQAEIELIRQRQGLMNSALPPFYNHPKTPCGHGSASAG
jgi:hypothetical protein